MKVTKKLFLVALLLSLILSIGAVTAQDNMTFEKSSIQDVSTETNNKGTLSISDEINQQTGDETSSLGESNSHNVEGNNFTSIQKSIDSANDGDTVYLDGKTYNGFGDTIQVNKQLTIVGGSESNPELIATLDAGKLSGIMSVSANNVIIQGIKFVNGNEESEGGAIHWTGDNGTLNNSYFVNNHAFHAGAIYWDSVNEGHVSECKFINNSADNDAGGLYAWKSNIIVSNSLFENNSARDSGALKVYWATVNITNCNFINNHANRNGGALVNSLATINIKNGTFENNRANSNGGAISSSGNLDVSESNFKNNQALSGGAIYHSRNNCIVSKSFFVDNYAQYGGAITSESTSNINNNTFKDNDALNAGSAILVDGPNNSITGNLIENDNTNISSIHIANNETLIIEGNNFTNPDLSMGYDEIIIEFEENYIGFIGKTVSFPFYVHTTSGKPVSGDVNLIKYFSDGDAFGREDLGRKTLNNGRTAFDINLPNYKSTVNFEATFYLGTGEIIRDFNIEVVDRRIIGVYQYDDTDDVYVKLVNDVTGIVMFDIGGNNYFTEISNGEALIKVTGLANGKYAVNLIYSGDDNYPREENIIVIEVNHAATTVIEVDGSFEGFVGKSIQIPVYIHDSLAKPLNGYATVYGYATQELIDGRTTFTITLPDNAAVLSLAVLYDDNVKMTTVTVRDDPIKNIYHDTSNDTVTVELENGATGTVTVKVSGKNYTSIVNNSCSIVEIKDLANGDYAATVIYSGDENYPNEEKIIILTVKHDTPVNPVYKISQNKDIAVAYSGKAAYKVLVTMDGKPVAGENIIISFNGKNNNVKTDANGYATINLDTSIKPGSYNVKATYNGVSVTNKVTVKQIIKASDKKVKKSAKTTKVKISLSKVDGKYLKSKTLNVKFNGKTYKVKTNSKGIGVWNVKKSMLKKLKVGKKYKYTVSYGKDTLTKKLTIRK